MTVPELLQRLHEATDARAAAEALFEALPPAPEGIRVLRTMLHRRTDSGYLALHVRQHRKRGAEDSLQPTRSTWEWLRRFPRGLVLEVDERRVIPLGRPEAAEDNAIPDAFSEGSQRILSDRRAGRVLVLPLPGFAGTLAGLLSVEMGHGSGEEGFGAWSAALRERVALAAPWILGLPAPRTDPKPDPLLPVVGRAMSGPLEVLDQFARFTETIVLRGETGTGKTMLARWAHARSRWRDGPFVHLMLTSGAHGLLAGELYGWRKGAHSTATEDRPGRVAAAEGGVLFIDEIGDASPQDQKVLLQLLDRQPYTPVGSDRPRHPKLGIVLATNRDLESLAAEGKFRRDLLARMGSASVVLPPLRERVDEVAGWARCFLDERAQTLGVSPPAIAPEVLARWEAAPWPGNLRELQRVIERVAASALARGSAVVELSDLPPEAPAGALSEALRGSAVRFLHAVQDGRLDLADADVLRAYVLEAAVEEHVDVTAAFRALREDALVRSRNHHAELRKQRARREAFEAKLKGG